MSLPTDCILLGPRDRRATRSLHVSRAATNGVTLAAL